MKKDVIIVILAFLALTGLLIYVNGHSSKSFGSFVSGFVNPSTAIPSVATPQTMQTSTTTICAIQSPTGTSTLTFASALFTVSSTTAGTITFAQAATAYATTTIIGQQYIIAANAQATIIASTTPGQSGTQTVFGPSQWLVVGMSGGTGNFSPTGRCTAVFITS